MCAGNLSRRNSVTAAATATATAVTAAATATTAAATAATAVATATAATAARQQRAAPAATHEAGVVCGVVVCDGAAVCGL